MPNVVMSERCIVTRSIVCVNNALGRPITLCTGVVKTCDSFLSVCQLIENSCRRKRIDCISQLILIRAVLSFLCVVSRDAFFLPGLHFYDESNNQQKVWLSCMCLHVCGRVPVCLCTVWMFVLMPSSEMQQPSKSQFRKLLCSIGFTHLHLHTHARTHRGFDCGLRFWHWHVFELFIEAYSGCCCGMSMALKWSFNLRVFASKMEGRCGDCNHFLCTLSYIQDLKSDQTIK